ncbi:hypothetical protein QYE76_065851 [Lolium multiflorum]|uniref:Uncharacterized protein n=1 Tax=Lolium multiflorum TaxID=4521 RepID=A0AAD8W954_LOLMU|nr:hypothetical protein QYE76_065851 [Lolium multiflorum]
MKSFLSDALQSWTINDIMDDDLQKKKVLPIPPKFRSAQDYFDIQSQLLIEEVRETLKSSVLDIKKTQVLHITAAQEIGGSILFLDIDLNKARSSDDECLHIANDFDMFVLSCESPIGLNFTEETCCLGMAIDVGEDTYYQKSFTVLVSKGKIQPEKIKFVTFLTNLRVKIKISAALSLDDKQADSIETVLNLQKSINKRCGSCGKVDSLSKDTEEDLHAKQSIISRVICTHQRNTEIVWTPPGTGHNSMICHIAKEIVNRGERVFICLPTAEGIWEFLKTLDEPSNFGDVLVLNKNSDLQKNNSFGKTSLEKRSHELYCCLKVWKSWMKETQRLLDLDVYCDASACCPRPVECTLVHFSLKSFLEKFDNIAGLLKDCLETVKKLSIIWLPDCDASNANKMLDILHQLSHQLHSDGLTDETIKEAFGPLGVPHDSIEKNLNATKIDCLQLIDTLVTSLKLPQLESREEIEKFCIIHSCFIVSTPECASQLHEVQMKPFQVLIVGHAGLISESEILIPLNLPLLHVVLLGDHLRQQPSVKSKGHVGSKNTAQSAAIMALLESLYADMNADVGIKIGVICLSTNDANIVRSQLTSKHKLHDKIILEVKSIDSLKLDWFDVVILSTLAQDYTKIQPVKETSLTVALTCSRHLCWIVGISSALLSFDGIWRKLIADARGRKVGQEITWVGRPHKTKYILSHVRDQKDDCDSCTVQTSLGTVESIKKHQHASLVPPQDFNWKLSAKDLKDQYEKKVGKKLSDEEDSKKKGTQRLTTNLDILQEHGVKGSNGVESEDRIFKISSYSLLKPMDVKKNMARLMRGDIMPCHFRLSRNYFYLQPGEVYQYDEKCPYIHKKSGLPVSHAVMMVGGGILPLPHAVDDPQARFHTIFQNSEGETFGIGGRGKVLTCSLKGLYHVRIRGQTNFKSSAYSAGQVRLGRNLGIGWIQTYYQPLVDVDLNKTDHGDPWSTAIAVVQLVPAATVQGHSNPNHLVFATVFSTHNAPGDPSDLQVTNQHITLLVLASIEEHVRDVSRREFEALTLDHLPPTPDLAHRHGHYMVEENAGMASGSEGPTGDLPELKALALNEASRECDTASSETGSEVVVEEEPEDESDFDLEEELRLLKEYKERMFNKDFTAQSATLAASCDENSAIEHVTEHSEDAEWARRLYLLQDESIKACLDARRTTVKSSRDEPRSEVSDKDIIENGEKWMTEEVMVAFKEYIKRTDKLRELMYCFEKLCHQCFNVECYFKIFHHFNFTVKTKLPSSDDWESRTYFAELKEMFGEKYYFCCPLESSENGQCYACSNQGVDDLRHPATGGFERGLPDTVFPYIR